MKPNDKRCLFLLVVGIALGNVSAVGRPSRSHHQQSTSGAPAVPPSVRSATLAVDSVVITIYNNMNHPWDFTYDRAGARAPLGHIGPETAVAFTIRDASGDSVKVWAASVEMGEVSRTFPTHSGTPLTWEF